MKTIKTLVAATAVSLLTLSNAHAGGVFADTMIQEVLKAQGQALSPLPLLPENQPRVPRCWPKWVDPRLIHFETSFPRILPLVPGCLAPIDPRVVDVLGHGQPVVHNFQSFGQ